MDSMEIDPQESSKVENSDEAKQVEEFEPTIEEAILASGLHRQAAQAG